MDNLDRVESLVFDDMVPGLDLAQRVSLVLLLIGEKPAVSVKFMDEDKKTLIEDFVELTGFEHLSFETGMHHKYYVSRSMDRFQLLEKVEKGSPYHTVRSEGLFLGYPRSAVDFYAGNRRKASEILKAKIADMLEKNLVDPSQLHYLDLVSYVPEASAEGVLEAIDHGKVREEELERFDEENGVSIGEKLLDEVFNRSTPFKLR